MEQRHEPSKALPRASWSNKAKGYRTKEAAPHGINTPEMPVSQVSLNSTPSPGPLFLGGAVLGCRGDSQGRAALCALGLMSRKRLTDLPGAVLFPKLVGCYKQQCLTSESRHVFWRLKQRGRQRFPLAYPMLCLCCSPAPPPNSITRHSAPPLAVPFTRHITHGESRGMVRGGHLRI